MTDIDADPRNCCGLKPQLFLDTKTGSTVKMFVVACGDCGKYADALTKKLAVLDWNMGVAKYNPGRRREQ